VPALLHTIRTRLGLGVTKPVTPIDLIAAEIDASLARRRAARADRVRAAIEGSAARRAERLAEDPVLKAARRH